MIDDTIVCMLCIFHNALIVTVWNGEVVPTGLSSISEDLIVLSCPFLKNIYLVEIVETVSCLFEFAVVLESV